MMIQYVIFLAINAFYTKKSLESKITQSSQLDFFGF